VGPVMNLVVLGVGVPPVAPLFGGGGGAALALGSVAVVLDASDLELVVAVASDPW